MAINVLSCNVNGIRSASQKNFWPWLRGEDPDVVCLQEIRATTDKFPREALEFEGYHKFIKSAVRPGYSGVAIYSKLEPLRVVDTTGYPLIDEEGRFLQLDFTHTSIISAYFPSGSSGQHRQEQKYLFLDIFFQMLAEFKKSGRSYIICGDWNIAHKIIDIKNWKSNQKNSGFLPEERAWMDRVIDELGFIDSFRVLNNNPDEYTWWSNRGNARANNVGWRIDYQIVTPCLRNYIKKVGIFRDQWFSDHAPLSVIYDIPSL